MDADLTKVVVGALETGAARQLARAASEMVPSIQALISHLDGQQDEEVKLFTDAEGALPPAGIALPEPGGDNIPAYLNASFEALAPFAELEAAAERLLAAAGRRVRDDAAAVRDLAAAARQLPDQDPQAAATLTGRLIGLNELGDLPAEPSLTAADAPGVVTWLERIAGLREATRTVLTAVAAPLDLAARARALADPVRPLLPQIFQGAQGELDAAVWRADTLRGELDAVARMADTLRGALDTAVQPTDPWSAALAEAGRQADASMVKVTDDLANRARGELDAAVWLADTLRGELDAAVRRADTLEGELDAAVQQLDAVRPAYQEADQATAAQVDALRTVLEHRDQLEQIQQAGDRLATAVQAIVAAAIDELPRTADSLRSLALGISGQVRSHGHDALADALTQARLDVAALVGQELPAPGALAIGELDHTITAMAPMTRLTTAVTDAITIADDDVRQGVDRLRQAAGAVQELTLQVFVPSPALESFREAHQRLGALAELPARPPATSPSFHAVAEADQTATSLGTAMPGVLTEAFASIGQRREAARNFAQAVRDLVTDNRTAVPGADGLDRELGDALRRVSATEAAIGHEQPGWDSARLAGQAQAAASAHEAVTALEEITERALASAASPAQQVETARELSAALPGLLPFIREAQRPALSRQLDDATRAVRDLPVPQPRPGAADEAVSWVRDVNGALRAATALMTVARSVARAVAQPLDALRPEAAVAADVARTASALPAARQDADLAARLDAAVQALERRRPLWWPARADDLTTARQAAGVLQAVKQRDEMVQDIQADIMTALRAAEATLTRAAADVLALAEAARALLPSPGEQDTLNGLIDRARQLAARPVPPPALGTLAAAAAAGRDLERLASVSAAVTDLIAAARARLAERLRGSGDLAEATLHLRHQTHPASTDQLFKDIFDAGLAAESAVGTVPSSLITPDDASIAVAALHHVTKLEHLARQVLRDATDPVAEAWQSVTDARRLAQVVRTLAPPGWRPGAGTRGGVGGRDGRRGPRTAAPDAA